MRIPSRPVSGELSPSIAPLIGVVILIALLAPFVDRPAKRPAQSPPPPEADFDAIVIRVSPGPRWQVNGVPMGSLDELRQALTPVANIKRDAPIIIQPLGDVPPSDMTEVFDLMRQIGFERVQRRDAAK